MKKIFLVLSLLCSLPLFVGAMEPANSLKNKLVLTIEELTLYRAGDFANNPKLDIWKTSNTITKDTLLVKVSSKSDDEFCKNSAPKYYPVEDILVYADYYYEKSPNTGYNSYTISYTIKPMLAIAERTNIKKENSTQFMSLLEFAQYLNKMNQENVPFCRLDREGNIQESFVPNPVKSNQSSISIGSYKFDTSNTNSGLYAKLSIFAVIGLALYLKPSLFLEPFKYFFGGWWQQRIEN